MQHLASGELQVEVASMNQAPKEAVSTQVQLSAVEPVNPLLMHINNLQLYHITVCPGCVTHGTWGKTSTLRD